MQNTQKLCWEEKIWSGKSSWSTASRNLEAYNRNLNIAQFVILWDWILQLWKVIAVTVFFSSDEVLACICRKVGHPNTVLLVVPANATQQHMHFRISFCEPFTPNLFGAVQVKHLFDTVWFQRCQILIRTKQLHWEDAWIGGSRSTSKQTLNGRSRGFKRCQPL